MAYTYDDFVKAANQSGLMGQFSQDDLNLAQKYPEFGLSVLSLKKDYNNAATAEQRLLANQAANELRKSYGNYSGGADGGSFRLESKLNRRADDLLGQIGSFGSFSYDEAPTYENAFAQQQKDLLIGNKIRIEKNDTALSVVTDSKWLTFMLGQIVNNSIKYRDAAKQPCISFAVEEMADKTVLKIRDNGIGIPEQDIDRVFDKTFTGENGRKGNASTGMGLYICKQLCNKLGHAITIASVYGEYTEVEIAFGKETFLTKE